MCYINMYPYLKADISQLNLPHETKNNKNSSGDEIANVNFCTTTTYMYRPAPTPIEPTC